MLLPNARTYEERAEALDERASNLRNEADRLARRVADSAAAVGTGPPSDGLVRRYARVRKLAKRAERRADELWTKGTAFDSEIKTAERIGATAAAQQANASQDLKVLDPEGVEVTDRIRDAATKSDGLPLYEF
ncbi:hypothetical protein FGG69_gp04 [Salinibacter phage SRUTV-1]|uniref:Uncharacterized protein n=1 Tax=Salinibacter phage SRUTV-1 TaxID=2684227 RepID=A0A2D3FAJ7_9CAUD|nr:hypothetical protein FGG69_gp04 [Salinibacter phage SRUTV-1]ATU47031.1 hypothetical protein [Salinibacter phage SRUTV-1]